MDNELKTVESLLRLIDTAIGSIYLVASDRRGIPRRDLQQYRDRVQRIERSVSRLDDIIQGNPDYKPLTGQVDVIRGKYNDLVTLVA